MGIFDPIFDVDKGIMGNLFNNEDDVIEQSIKLGVLGAVFAKDDVDVEDDYSFDDGGYNWRDYYVYDEEYCIDPNMYDTEEEFLGALNEAKGE